MNETRYVDPAHFLKSFFVVIFLYVFLFTTLLLSMWGISRIRFPRIFELWGDQDEFAKVWENQPELLFPTELCLWLIAACALISIFVGLQVAFWAPFSKAGHGVFLSILSIVTFLQMAITEPKFPKWMMMAMLVSSAILIVVASRFGERWFSAPLEPEEVIDEPS